MSKGKFEKQVDELIKLAKDWRQFSKETYGWTTEEHHNSEITVRTYFAASGHHTVTDFRYKGTEIGIAFFRPEQLEIRVDAIARVPEIIEEAKALLEECKKEQAAVSEQEKKDPIEAEKLQLKKRLSELGGEL